MRAPGRLRALALPAGLLLAWEAAGRVGLTDVRFVPPPSTVLGTVPAMVASRELLPAIGATVVRFVTGYAIASAVGVTLGLCFGLSPALRRRLGPLLEMLRPIPGVTLIPVAILWFGIGNPSKIPVIAWAAFFPIFLNTALGFQETPAVLLQAARIMELHGVRLFWKVLMPAAVPAMFAGLRLSVGYALISTTGTEMIMGPDGLGFLVLEAQRTFRAPAMFATIVTIALLGFAGASAVHGIERRLLHYRR